MNLEKLKKPMVYKWKPQECKEYGATCVAYVDSRDVQDLLDEVCGPENWQDKYYEVKGHVYCTIGINVGEWIWKSDCGTESNFEAEKGESSDAFKRAAVKWGVGRFLYSLGVVKLKTAQYKGKYYPADDSGNIIWDKPKLSEFCNSKLGKPAQKKTAPKPTTGAESVEIMKEAFDQYTSKYLLETPEGWDFDFDKFIKAVNTAFGKLPTNKASIPLIVEKIKPVDVLVEEK